MTRTLVIGLGNPILSDDGAGIYAARMVKAALPSHAEVDIVELSVGGLALMEAMIGYCRVILIDALQLPESVPGRVVLFDAGDLPQTLNTASTHDADLPTALEVGKRLGVPLPAEEDIQIVGIQPYDVLTFSEKPTPYVAAALPCAAMVVLHLLGYVSLENLEDFSP
jgi:hydrogenase maturation protease